MSDMPNQHEKSPAIEHSITRVEIYTWMACGYCVRAKRLLREKNIKFTEYAIDGDEQARRLMTQRADGRRSMPQIFIDGDGIGGYLELQELEDAGRLDELVAVKPCMQGLSGDLG